MLALMVLLAQAVGPDTAEGDRLVAAGLQHFQAERYEDAAEAFQRAIGMPATTEPRTDILLVLGQSYVKLGRHEEAVRALEQSVDLDRSNVAGWSNLGVACAKLGQLDKAAVAYGEALQRKPTDVTSLIGLGALEFRRTGDPRRALPLYERAVAADPQSMNAWFNVSAAALLAGECERAVEAGLRARDTGMANFAELEVKLREAGCVVPQESASEG